MKESAEVRLATFDRGVVRGRSLRQTRPLPLLVVLYMDCPISCPIFEKVITQTDLNHGEIASPTAANNTALWTYGPRRNRNLIL